MDSLSFYHRLDRVPFLKSVALKVAFVAFIGIHVPLIFSVLLIMVFEAETSPLSVLLYLLVFTIMATGLTLYYLNKVIEPIRFLGMKLQAYVRGGKWIITSSNWHDEAGGLSRDLDVCIQNLERTLDDKNELYGLLSHDLKGMLATLQAGLMVLQMDFDANGKDVESIREKIELIERQILSVNSLSYYYRNPALEGDMKDEITSIHLREITNEVVSLYDSALRMDKKSIKIEIDENITINSERFLIRHLIFNLVDNAVKYSEKGTTVYISYRDGEFQVSNEKNKQTVFGMGDWQKSTGMGHKIITKTANDLGLSLTMDYCEETYSVKLGLVSMLKKAS